MENKIQGFIIFSDLKGFSKLTPQKQQRYIDIHVGKLGVSLADYFKLAKVRNTWGDAIMAVFEDGQDAANFMLAYRRMTAELLSQIDLQPRIAGHYGEITVFFDPLLEQFNTISDEVNIAARIEPITRPGEIFVSKEFKKAYDKDYGGECNVKFERLGIMPLAKGFAQHELFRLIGGEEEAHIIDTLFSNDLPVVLPTVQEVDETEKNYLQKLKETLKSAFQYTLNPEQLVDIMREMQLKLPEDVSPEFGFQMAKLCKDYAFYEIGLQWIEKIQDYSVIVSGILLAPYKTKKIVVELKADLLTRLERYDECADILYSLKNNLDGINHKNEADVLARLAAQFKRKALFQNHQPLDYKQIDRSNVENAAMLYLQAFRYNIEEYYPAINAAYLLTMLGDERRVDGEKLASYIYKTWFKKKGSNIWLDLTLAETKIILNDFGQAYILMKEALNKHRDSISLFTLETTRIQIEQFLNAMGWKAEGASLIELLHNQQLRGVN